MIEKGKQDMGAIELILAIHKNDGAAPIAKLDKPWERKVDDKWTFWVNGQMELSKLPTGAEIQPGECFVEFNGWPAGLFNIITGEGTLAVGAVANYETFCDALRAVLP